MKRPSLLFFLYRHISPYKKQHALMALAPLYSSFKALILGYALKLLVKCFQEDNEVTYSAIAYPLMLFFLNEMIIHFLWGIRHFFRRYEPLVVASILKEAYSYVQGQGYAWFQRQHTGTLTSKIRGLNEGYENFWKAVNGGFFRFAFKIAACMVGLLFLAPILGIWNLLWPLSFSLISVFLKKKTMFQEKLDEEKETEQQFLGEIGDNLANMDVLMAFSGQEREKKRLDKYAKLAYIPRQRVAAKAYFFLGLTGSIIYTLGIVGSIVLLGYLVYTEYLSIANFAFAVWLTYEIDSTLWHFILAYFSFIKEMSEFRTSLSLFDSSEKVRQTPDAQPLQVRSPSIEIKGLRFGYQKHKKILDGFSCNIQPGEKIGIVGHSGAGKSSLFHLLLRYFDYDEGQICIDGQDIRSVTLGSLHKVIALIPQDTLLFNRSIADNVRYGHPEATEKEVIEACKKAQIHDFIQALPDGYQTMANTKGSGLSGGQRQRIAIARALIKEAPILLLDEATSALDVQTEHKVQQAINYLVKNKCQTLIAIAHRLFTVKGMDRLLVLDQGKVAEEGSHSDLLAQKGIYYALWQDQKGEKRFNEKAD